MRRLLVGWLVGSFLCLAAASLDRAAGHVGDWRKGHSTNRGRCCPGVAIVVTNEETGVFREVTSGADGTYFASQLVPGPVQDRREARQASGRSSAAA